MDAIIYRIAICDDEEDFVSSLKYFLCEILKDKGIDFCIETFYSGEMLLSHIKEEAGTFDLFLLDIFMKETNGIDTAKDIRLTNDSAGIIFITSSEQYVFSGYEVQALQYLLKPIDSKALSSAIMFDLKRRYENKYFVFKTRGITQKVLYDDIEYLESTLKSIKIATKQGIYEMYEKISNIENILPKLNFCRCHRGFIINFKQVSKISAQSIVTISGTLIPIGKTYAKDTNRAFLNYVGEANEF